MAGNGQHLFPVTQAVINTLGQGLGHRDPVQQCQNIRKQAAVVRRILTHAGNLGQQPGAVPRHQGPDNLVDFQLVNGAQHRFNGILRNLVVTKGYGLVRQAQGIAHTAVGGSPQLPERWLLIHHLLFVEHSSQIADHALGGKVFQIELQAAGQHRHRQLLWVRCGKQKLDMLRRLFEGFQQGIKAAGGKHVYFVNQVYLETTAGGHVLDVVE